MKKAFFVIATAFFLTTMLSMRPVSVANEKESDSELLGKAIEYFQSGKFHEALLIFDKLDRRYKLNPRFRAFIAVCHYYDWNDEQTCEYLDSLIPQLEPFAPHERSIYYYINAESHFNLKQYEQAIPYYEQALNVCYDNEKSDALYRMGYCYLFNNDTLTATEFFRSALDYYQRFRNTSADQPRIAQIQKMVQSLAPDRIEMATWQAESKPIPTDPQSVRDTLRHRIINDIDLSDIFEHQIIVEDSIE